jgi:hypothetical protein
MPLTTNEPQQELIYFMLIDECVGIIKNIRQKTSFIQLEKSCENIKEPICGSPLEEKIKELLRELKTLNNSYKL